jgi:NAD(P)-dependent dehydrogenase (short-subunit alcohol dehydrogenase family)
MSVSGKIVVVTGGASGIGRASSIHLARQGARIVIADRDAAAAEAVVSLIAGSGGTALAVGTDIGKSASVDDLVKGTIDRWGRIDALVHCAGICPREPLFEMSDEAWSTVLRINLDGTFFIVRAVGRAMRAQRSGTMILLASDRGLNGAVDYAHYAASKGGTIALAKSAAIALGPYGVTVNALNPGMTDTPLARGAISDENWRAKQSVDVLGRHSEPEEIAEMVLFLAGTGGGFMTGQVIATRMRNFS